MADGLAGGTLTVLLAGGVTTGLVVEVDVGARVVEEEGSLVEEGVTEAVPGMRWEQFGDNNMSILGSYKGIRSTNSRW